jgi:hypothetical protein
MLTKKKKNHAWGVLLTRVTRGKSPTSLYDQSAPEYEYEYENMSMSMSKSMSMSSHPCLVGFFIKDPAKKGKPLFLKIQKIHRIPRNSKTLQIFFGFPENFKKFLKIHQNT